MIIDELNKKIADIENLANDKTSTIESKVSDLTDGLLMVADAVDIIPEMVDEKITAITKEFSTIKDSVSKVKAQKGEKGAKGDKGDSIKGDKGDNGKDGSPDTGEQIVDKLNELEGVLDTKVLKDFEMPNVKDLERQINTIGNQTLRLLSRPTTTGGGSVSGVSSLNSLTGAVTLSAGNNVTLNESGNDIEITANFTQEGKYMISGGITWSGTGLTYDVSFLNYFFNGNKTANPTQVTLAASDPTNNRFDAIVVDEAGTVTTITGTPSANPEVPAIPEDQLQVTIILVAAGSTTPTIASEEIYMDDPTTGWTFSTYQTATPTGSINFAGTSSPKQGTECIEASTDARLGARFVRDTSFDAFQYTMLQVWVRFTGTAVATNKSLNVRFENSAGTLVANTVNLFSYGLQRGVLNTWQLVVVPITAFGALPATVKGLKMIMAGGTVGVVRQWDIDFMILTNGSVPYANVPTIAFYKNGVGIASQTGLNIIQGTGMTITAANDPTNGRVNYTLNAAGGSPAGSNNQIQINQSGAFFADSTFQKSDTDFNVGLDHTTQSPVTFTGNKLNNLKILVNSFSGTYPTTYTVTIDGTNKDYVIFPTSSISGSGFQVGEIVTSSSGGSATIDAINLNADNSYEDLVLSSVTGTFLQFDVITGGTSSTTATLDSDLGQQDTYTWTDGTTNVSNVICKTPGSTRISYDVLVTFDTGTGHTLSDSWTWTYSKVNENILDFSNNDYKFQSTFGTDTFGYQIKENGEVVIGNLSGGNGTSISIDDVNEQITISNLPAYDDDTAAGVGGLTAGMVYMTTGSGSAPLNAAGILMIKQ